MNVVFSMCENPFYNYCNRNSCANLIMYDFFLFHPVIYSLFRIYL